MRQLLTILLPVGIAALGLLGFSTYSSSGGAVEKSLVNLILSKEAKAAGMRLHNLERAHPSSKNVKALRQQFDRDPENAMLHDTIALYAEYSDVIEFAEMSESERKNVSLVKSAMLLPRFYSFSSASTKHARKWGLPTN